MNSNIIFNKMQKNLYYWSLKLPKTIETIELRKNKNPVIFLFHYFETKTYRKKICNFLWISGNIANYKPPSRTPNSIAYYFTRFSNFNNIRVCQQYRIRSHLIISSNSPLWMENYAGTAIFRQFHTLFRTPERKKQI